MPFQLILALIIIIKEIGFYFLPGVVVIILSTYINILYGLKCLEIEKKEKKEKDKRMQKIMGGLLSVKGC